jgi:hypothetical protein
MTVDDSVVDGQARFRAIGTATSKRPLWQRWYDSVVAILQSNDRRRVRFDDVPEGALEAELRDRCSAMTWALAAGVPGGAWALARKNSPSNKHLHEDR